MKKFLIVIKDNVEFQNFVDYFQYFNINSYKLFILASVGENSIFQKDLQKLDSSINILNIWEKCKPSLVDKIKYWIQRQTFYIINSNKSESCFQKMWIHFQYSEEKVLEGKSLQYRKLISYILRKILIKLNFKNFIFSLKYKSKCFSQENISFDYIVFMRPDSSNNIPIYNTFKRKETKIITFIRNYDTPALKGIFTVPTDITLVTHIKLRKLLYKLHSEERIGKVFILKSLEVKFNNKKNSILYCTSHPKFFPKEPVVLKNIIEKLSKKYNIKIKLHPADSFERYEIEESFFLKKEFLINYQTDYGIIKFHSLKTIKEYYEYFKDYDILITHSSTIVVDAYRYGIKKLFFIKDQDCKYKEVFKREHLIILENEFNIKSIDFQGNFNECK